MDLVMAVMSTCRRHHVGAGLSSLRYPLSITVPLSTISYSSFLSPSSQIPQIVSLVVDRLTKRGVNGLEAKSKSLARNKELLGEALSPLGDKAVKGGQGATYLWANLPDKYPNAFEVVCWFARRHGVLLLPGSACSTSGCIRITYGMLTESECNVAAKRLKRGVEELIRDGMVEYEFFSDSGQPNML
ncbi:Aromatic aminotransferase ISS1 [Camellia lanceoleosa]|uniref:Aromatic aminotransferase ISS1 n=1 Tax=Camellia lanceoleosa TaxID=1840588 RepID=A0ACC0G0U2_9ERIC|nr:Aromatic aminotransferase ISS1 [Camellia lanceoleosa]KAI7993955.1 Aromatic aminotransferase ISS1 [Camellia lanceoleosa]